MIDSEPEMDHLIAQWNSQYSIPSISQDTTENIIPEVNTDIEKMETETIQENQPTLSNTDYEKIFREMKEKEKQELRGKERMGISERRKEQKIKEEDLKKTTEEGSSKRTLEKKEK
ncbi:hypothetical protein JTB14_022796 [Gonioctena quinquepunctata]|nr:hypothetical protein JTB14_022796 [Gonioctena quinquepunctata]